MCRASASETFRQRIIFSVASRFLFAGRKIQIKLAKPRPNFKQNFSGKRQTTLLNNFKNLYSMSATLLCAVYSAAEKFFLQKKSPRACEGFLYRLKFLAATSRRRWRRRRRVIMSAVTIIGRGRRCARRIVASAVTIGRRRIIFVIVAIMGSRRRVIAVPTLPIFAVAAFVFSLAPKQIFIPEVRPLAVSFNILRFDLRVQVVGGCCLRLSAEKNCTCRHGD